MQYSVPDYYKEFSCLADKCEDTCCAGWQIVVDKKSLKKYKEETGDYRKKLKKAVDFRNETFRQDNNKRCAFLKDNNLCDMYLNLGPDSLCKTCRMYPRHVEEFENVREITLSVSCPEVARILLSKKEPVTFLSKEREGEEEYEDFDPFLYSQLVEAREVIRGILQDRSKALEVRALLVLGLAHDMQGRLQRGELFACEEVWNKYRSKRAEIFAEEKVKGFHEGIGKRYTCSKKFYDCLCGLELLRSDWDMLLEEAGIVLYRSGRRFYDILLEDFEIWIAKSGIDLTTQCEQLLVYFIDTYFCGGVYDGCVFDKVNIAVASVFLIYELLAVIWDVQNGRIDFPDVVKMVYRFSRELEHSDSNILKAQKWPSLLRFL